MKKHLIETSFGSYYVPADNLLCPIARKLATDANRDKYLLDMIQLHVREGSLAIDVGSYVGTVAVQLRKLGFGRIVAFEANPDLVPFVAENLGLNTAGEYTVHNYIVFDECDPDAKFPVPEFDQGARRFTTRASFGVGYENSKGDTYNVPKTTIDRFNFQNVGLLKIDAEGSDLRALRGARETMLREQMPVVFEYGAGGMEELDPWSSYLSFLTEVGYHIVESRKADHLAIPRI